MTDKLPDNGGYVAAAYLVFLALLLIYFAVMSARTSRVERELHELSLLADERVAAAETPEHAGADA